MMTRLAFSFAATVWSLTLVRAAATNVIRDVEEIPEFMKSRSLEDEITSVIPDGISICNDNFFGRQASSPYEKQPFCVNNGRCKASWRRDDDDAPCDCVDGYEGPHCEFEAGDQPDTCKLNCEHHSQCKLGASSWQHYYRNVGSTWTNPLDMQHCECKSGYTGLLCELVGVPCGESHCHHGGTCIQTSGSDGSTQHYCDCTTTLKSSSGSLYAGKYCEHEATLSCTESTDQSPHANGNQFCVNGGTCKSESHYGCNCPTGYVGPVCEFEDNGHTIVGCNITCMNHGICRKGAKDVTIMTKYGFEGNASAAYNQDFEHCVCPSGYVGLQCDFQLDQCPGGAHACLNGGKCVTVPNGSSVSYACDCTNAETSSKRFAGEFCEMEATEFCTIDGSKSHNGVGINSFCTNGGTCLKLVPTFEEHPGCNCPQGFDGENCQYTVPYEKKRSNVAAILTGVLAAASIFAGAVILRKRVKAVSYNHIQAKTLPPTLDIIHSLGHDREAEFTESSHSEQPTGMSKYGQSTSFYVDDTDDMVVPRKKYWPRGIRSKVSTSSPVQIFNDVDLDDGEDRFSRKTYWPNDVRNDATNPIHVFDDISVRSESVNHHGVCNRSDDSIDDSNNNDDISTDSDESPEIV